MTTTPSANTTYTTTSDNTNNKVSTQHTIEQLFTPWQEEEEEEEVTLTGRVFHLRTLRPGPVQAGLGGTKSDGGFLCRCILQ